VITSEVLTSCMRQTLPDAVVAVTDRTGTHDHFNRKVVSDQFKGKSQLGMRGSDVLGAVILLDGLWPTPPDARRPT